jgi:tetratricopeptide (TPR) repeat protein/predicted aspartyl protease
MSFIPIFFCRLGYAALLSAVLLPGTAGAACDVRSFEIPVTMKQMRAVAHLRINGMDAPLTLDSGAFFSVLTDAATAQMNLKPRWANLGGWGIAGRAEFYVTNVARLGVQASELKNVDFLVGGNEPGAGTLGLLGRNILSVDDTEYDLANGVVRLMTPNADCKELNLAYWAKSVPVVEVPLIIRRGERIPAIKVEVKINGKPVEAILDTGAQSILSLRAAKRVGLISDERSLKPAGMVYGVGEGELQSWIVPVENFELGTERIVHSGLRVADMVREIDTEMLIGIDFFLSHRIYVARSQKKIYFTSNGGPAFDLSTTVPAITDALPALKDADALSRRGTAFAARDEHAKALADLDRAIELAPAVASYRTQRAHVKLALRQKDAALADLEEALRLDPGADEARLERARIRFYDGALEVVRTDLDVLDKRLPHQSDMRRQMGDLYLDLKEPLLAVPQYSHWIKTRPRQIDLHNVLNSRCWARALANAELDKALDDCDDALDEKPKMGAYLDSRGLVHVRLGKWDDAIEDYNKVLAIHPKASWSLWGRGLAHFGAGNHEQGLADIAAAKAARPGIEAEARRYGLDAPAMPGVAVQKAVLQ